MTIALIGNQNCGKTTLFNRLTGESRHVGNFPGVTVSHTAGVVRGEPEICVVDLPGIYSLSPYTGEEQVTRDFLENAHPDGILNIVDVTVPGRNLYLTLQLLEAGIPTVLALNMMDELREGGGDVCPEEMSAALGVPVIPISAATGEGIENLVKALSDLPKRGKTTAPDVYTGAVDRAVRSISALVEPYMKDRDISPRFVAARITEGELSDAYAAKTTEGEGILSRLHFTEDEQKHLQTILSEMARNTGTDCREAIADARYAFIDRLTEQVVTPPKSNPQREKSARIDRILTHRLLAFPTFILIMLAVFAVSFGWPGQFLSGLLSDGIDAAGAAVGGLLTRWGVHPILLSLVTDGIIAGVGGVLSFLPIVLLLFFLLSLLEDSGYMARVAFLMDAPLRKLGLSGRSFVPVLLGFGCTVPAVMAARTLPDGRGRRITTLLIPFASCSAKLPIYAAIAGIFFPRHAALVMISLYLAGILLAVLSALLFRILGATGESTPFMMELPSYRMPSVSSVLRLMFGRAKEFLSRAFTVVLLASVLIWLLQNFTPHLTLAADPGESWLSVICGGISVVLTPLGFADWRISAALLSGFTAKEAVIGTIRVLFGGDGALQSVLSIPAALSFLVFTLIYPPCAAAVNTVRRELGGAKYALFVILYQTGVAWLMSFLVYRVAMLFA